MQEFSEQFSKEGYFAFAVSSIGWINITTYSQSACCINKNTVSPLQTVIFLCHRKSGIYTLLLYKGYVSLYLTYSSIDWYFIQFSWKTLGRSKF